jgi:methylmalonyl-CoA mutase
MNYKRNGITRIYAPDDGRAMGLQGMINDLVQQSDFPTGDKLTNELDQLELKNPTARQNHQQLKIFRMLRKTLEAIQKE